MDVVQHDPYRVAVVKWMDDQQEGGDDCEKSAAAETECWRVLQENVWLCVEVSVVGHK